MIGSVPDNLLEIRGGVEAVVVNLLEGFKLINDIEVILLFFTKGEKEEKIVEYTSNIKIYYEPFKFPKFDILDYFFNRRILRETIAIQKPDVIHIQGAGPSLLRLLGFPKNKIVITQHGIMKEEHRLVSGFKKKLKFLFKIYIEKYLFTKFKNIIFISEYNKKIFRSKENLNYSQIIYNPVNSSFFKTDISKRDISSIIYVGKISYRKNLKLILQALKKLKENNIKYKLNIVGGFDDDRYMNEILAYNKKELLEEDVLFYGWLNQDELLKLYNQSSIFILPSLQETLPVSIEEAMAAGAVVVSSDVGGVSEMFEDKKSGFLFEKGNVEQLIEILESLYNNKDRIIKISKEARNEALKKYEPNAIAKEIIKFYSCIK